MNQLIKATIQAVIIPAMIMPFTVQAHEAGEFIFRAGLADIDPDSNSDLVLDVPGSGVSVDDKIAIGITGTYMYTDHIGFEILASTPFEHDIDASGSISGFGKLGSATHLPPTFSVQYFFGDKNSTVNPYVGLGLNYTIFLDEDTTQNLNDAVAAVTGLEVTKTKMSLDDSFGITYQLGVDIKLNDKWLLNAAVWKMDIDTTADISVNGGAVKTSIDVSIDPIVYMISVGYKF